MNTFEAYFNENNNIRICFLIELYYYQQLLEIKEQQRKNFKKKFIYMQIK